MHFLPQKTMFKKSIKLILNLNKMFPAMIVQWINQLESKHTNFWAIILSKLSKNGMIWANFGLMNISWLKETVSWRFKLNFMHSRTFTFWGRKCINVCILVNGIVWIKWFSLWRDCNFYQKFSLVKTTLEKSLLKEKDGKYP